jgi:Cu(I)/Ag(I) efflux system membrane protein CusA/SilA
VRSPLAVELFGADVASIDRAAVSVQRALAHVPGTRSAFAERADGGFYIDIAIKREQAARYGLSADDIHAVVAHAIGGENVAETVEGRERYPISVRYAREYRDDPERLSQLMISGMDGVRVPLGQVAEIRHVLGPAMLRSEGGQLVGFVFVDSDRPIADYVADAQRALAREVQLPAGVRVAWVGQWQSWQRASARLWSIVPLTLLLIAGLLYVNTRSWVESAIVLSAVPFSLLGAVWLLYALDYHLSVAVWVGMLALAGLDAETGVVMLLYLSLAYRRAEREGRMRDFADLREAIVEGAAQRLRPKLMTVATMMFGLLPLLLSDRTGADVMKRIAAPMVGGLATSFVLELAVYPALFALWRGRSLRRAPAAVSGKPASASP